MGFPFRGRTFVWGPSLPRVCATSGGNGKRCIALVCTARPQRPAKRGAGGSLGWPLRRLPVKGNAADSGPHLRRRGFVFHGSMKLSDFVTPSSAGFQPESAVPVRRERYPRSAQQQHSLGRRQTSTGVRSARAARRNRWRRLRR